VSATWDLREKAKSNYQLDSYISDDEPLTLESVHRLDLLLDGRILIGEFLGFTDHPLDVVGAEPSLIIGDGDRVGFAGSLVESGYLENTIG
jgi:hypothetical protein